MNHEIFNYLSNHFSQQPKPIDRLIVSSFVLKNNLKVKKNVFLQNYLIKKTEEQEYKKLMEFISILDKYNTQFGYEELVAFFEFVISPSDKVVNGAVYTPKYIRKFIVSKAISQLTHANSDIKVFDPACGCGGFLITAARELKKKTGKSYRKIFQENLFGLDIKDYSVTRSKLLLSLFAVKEGEIENEFQFNLHQGNALDFDWTKFDESFEGFHVVIGNPPYVCSRNIDKDSKKHLHKWSVCSSGHPDLYIPFFQIGLENLVDNGVLGFITMNTFFKSVNGRALREYFSASKFNFSIIDFGSEQVFKTKSTYTCICIIQKTKSDSIKYVKVENKNSLSEISNRFNLISYSNLKSHSGWNLQNSDIIDKIESTGTPFGDLFKTRNGIATLKNGIYIFDPIREDEKYYYLQNGSIFAIEKEICREIVNPNKLTAESNISSLKEKILFPYFFKNGKVKLLPEDMFKSKYPKAFHYLESKRNILATRDKGSGKYEKWYAYGRNQSLEKLKYKLFFPHITPVIPNYVINSNENLLFYNGIAVIGQNETDLCFLKKIMQSKLFWFYITNTSKPYGSGYFSLSRNYIKNFGVYPFSKEEYSNILNEKDMKKIDHLLEMKYEIRLPD